jgi:multidrug efflux system membrane fusion protein
MSKVSLIAATCVSAGVALAIWMSYAAMAQPSRAKPGISSSATAAVEQSAVPVTATKVQQQDVPIVIEGLGTVQPLNMATMHTQVQGTLTTVDFIEGQEVKQGQRLAQIDPRVFQAQVDQAKAALGRDQALLTNAQSDLNRSLPLLSRGFATPQQVDTQKAQVAQLQNTVDLDKASLEGAQTQLSFTTITAPFDGITGIRKIDPGNIVHPTDTNGLVTLTQVQPISVIFTLPSADIPTIQQAQAKGPVVVDVYDASNKVKLDEGKLLLIDNQVEAATGTVRLKAIFPNEKRALWPGVFVNAHLTVSVEHDALTLPLPAVLRGPAGPFVYAITPAQTATVRPVTTGQSRNGEIIVTKGLAAGDHVVLAGQYRLFEGARVDVVPPERANEVQNASTASAGMLP